MFIMTAPKYNQGILLDEYQNVYSLVSATQNKAGKVYSQWCKPKQGKDSYAKTDLPLGVRLGSKVQAVKILENFLEALKRGNMAQTEADREEEYLGNESDVPF